MLLLIDVEAESAAVDLIRALYDLTDGLSEQWCMLEELRGARASPSRKLDEGDLAGT